MSDCIFCKIAAGQLPCNKVYEDEDVLAFHDIHPFARVHVLIIPKHIATLADCTPSMKSVGQMLLLAPRLAKEQASTPSRLINTGRGGRKCSFTFMYLAGVTPSSAVN
jgi:histidine triad (HIT) family protein